MNFLYEETDEKEYKHINQTIPDGNMMNMYFIVMELNFGAIDADNSACWGYYIIGFSSYPYTLQKYFIIYGQVIYSGDMVCEGKYYFQSISILIIIFIQKINLITQLYL